uniref:Uncharacterized protein n=1 Tax=Geladintestivirus 6 TaxID=3233138 RepID=A0AAU8MK20_9CAUD
MNVTFAICLIVFSSFVGEIFTWIVRKNTTFEFGYVAAIRIIIICLSIYTIYCTNRYYDDYKILNENNSFKYELLQHQDSLINYQRTMIDDLANHLWKEYNFDIPQFDGDLKDNIDYEEQYIDSLYNTQL